MRVLLISHMPPPTTGIGSWTRRVLESGIPDCEISFVNSNMIGGRDPFQNTKVNIGDEIKRNWKIWTEERDTLKSQHHEIVHTNIPCTLMGMIRETITGLIAKRYGCKFIVHCHCTVPNVVNSRFKQWYFARFSKLVDGYIVLNTASYDFCKQYTNKPVEIIPNFVCKSELVAKSANPNRGIVKNVLFVGGVSADKGCDTLIRAAAKMPEVTFHLVGIITEEIRSMSIPKNVVLYGNKPKEFVHDIMGKADVFAFLSRYFGEGFSVALVEAMSAGLPCIVTDWAANADMIGRKGEGGIVIPQQDEDALINAIHGLASASLREAMSVRNTQEVNLKYTETTVLPQIRAFYQSVVDFK